MPSRKATSLRLSGTSSLIYFNSRPHRGRQLKSGAGWICIDISTHALTEGDGAGSFWRVCGRISTHALTEGDLQKYNFHLSAHISTHALTEGGFPLQEKSFSNPLFQLTPSRRATINAKIEFELEMISTHALTEGDSAAARSFRSLRHFNSRPHGGRLLCTLGRRTRYIFQLTPSRRATYSFAFFKTKFFISTHALTEGDRSCC